MKKQLIIHLSSEQKDIKKLQKHMNILLLRHFLMYYEKWNKINPELLQIFDQAFDVKNLCENRALRQNKNHQRK